MLRLIQIFIMLLPTEAILTQGTSSGAPFLTLGYAISQLSSGCNLIMVAAGTYR